MAMIELDGKIGGGSVLRVGIPLAIAHKKELHITNVRYNRKRRGIQAQHLTGVNLICDLTGSQVSGANIGSTEIFIKPGNKQIDSSYLPQIRVPSSAAISLIFQTVSNYVFATRQAAGFAFTGGGSHVSFSPNFDVLQYANAPLFEYFGLKTHLQLDRAGFYPKGGARGKIFMQPVQENKVNLEGGALVETLVISNASETLRSEKVAEQQLQGLQSIMKVDKKQIGYAPTDSIGGTISVVMRFSGGSFKSIANVFESGKNPLEIGKAAGHTALEELSHPCAVDEQMADQLVVPLTYAQSGSSYSFHRIYPHVKANYEVVTQLLGDVLSFEQKSDHYKLIRN